MNIIQCLVLIGAKHNNKLKKTVKINLASQIMPIFTRLVVTLAILYFSCNYCNAWRSSCPIHSQDNRESFLCIRPCDFDELPATSESSRQIGEKAAKEDPFFIVFFPPKNPDYQTNSRMKCQAGFKLVKEAGQCFCERPYTPYELEMQRREKCDQAFETCRVYGAKPYDCNHIVDTCPPMLVRDYCLAGKVFKMRFSKVIYDFCHDFLRLPNDGKQHFIRPDVEKAKQSTVL